MEHRTTRRIDAPREAVWAVLADLASWPSWTASMSWVRPEGDGTVGAGSRVRLKQPRLPAADFEITEWRPAEGFTWVSRSPGVTTTAGHHLEERDDGGTRLTLHLSQSGLLAPLVGWVGGRLIRRYVETEADGLQRRCEAP